MYKRISIVVTPEEEKCLKELAAKDRRSLSTFLRIAIEKGIKAEDSNKATDKNVAEKDLMGGVGSYEQPTPQLPPDSIWQTAQARKDRFPAQCAL